jgi:hypothetical protein
MKKRPPRAPPNGGDCTISKRGLSSTKVKKISSPGCELGTVPESRKSGGLGTEIEWGTWHGSCRAGSMPRGSNRGLPIVFLKKSSLFGKLARFKRPIGAF